MRQFGFDLWVELGLVLIAYMALLALPFAILVTLALIRWYRYRVARSMRATAGAAPPPDRSLPQDAAPGELRIERVAASSATANAARAMPLVATARHRLRRRALSYALAATSFPLVLAAAFIVSLDLAVERNLLLTYTLLLAFFLLVFATPAVLAPLVVVRREPRVLLLGVVLLLALQQAGDRFLGTDMTGLWLMVAAVPCAAVLLLNGRRLRAVGPVVFAATLLLFYGLAAGQAYGALYALEVIGPVRFAREDLAGLPFLEAEQAYLGWLFSLPAEAMLEELSALLADPLHVIQVENADALDAMTLAGFVAIALALSLVGVAAAWGFMRWLAARYRARRASDQMLTIDVLMLIFAIPMLLINLFPFDWIKVSGTLAGLLGYKLVAGVGLRRRALAALSPAPHTLLLLRVFGFDRRTQSLLEDLGRRWRHLGPIHLIGAPDAAYGTIEPHEFFDFLNGRLSRAFIKDRADLESRLVASSASPDPDGLFRIDDFFCHDDSWRMTVARLARDASAVLMDLRGFTAANQGCILEIEELIAAVPIARIVLLVDRSTDLPALERTLERAWRIRPDQSPNRGPGEHRLRLLQASPRRLRTLHTLLGLLCAAGRTAPLTASRPAPA